MWGPTKVAVPTQQQDGSRLFERHGLKLLNVGLLLYMCLGGLLFDYLGEFELQHSKGNGDNVGTKQVVNLAELRLSTVRRMWNITNQLNILYESNWTLLVLDELLDFERQFLDTLAKKSRENEWDVEEDQETKTTRSSTGDDVGGLEAGKGAEDATYEGDENGDEKEREKEREKQREKSARKQVVEKQQSSKGNRLKSIKKSLIHSLATITTIGLPNTAQPQSSAAKLATVLYGAFGIPLLFVSVSQSGKQLAHSGLNGMLLIRHYCCSLPIHYLCCTCNLFQCLRWLLWCCCCCCCCGSLCCFRNNSSTKSCRKSAPAGDKTTQSCDTTKLRPPELKLRYRRQRRSRSRRRRQSPDGATRSVRTRRQPAYVIKLTPDQQQLSSRADPNTSSNNQQNSVRLSSTSAPQHVAASNENYLETATQNDALVPYNSQPEVDENPYTSGLFLTSLSLLLIYLAVGAYVQMHNRHKTLVDAIYETYALLSTSKLPESFQLDRWRFDLVGFYSSLRPDLTKAPGKGPASLVASNETFIWDTIYLLCGLNLVSMCGHFARLWMSGDFDERFADCFVMRSNSSSSDHYAANNSPPPPPTNPNHLPSMGGGAVMLENISNNNNNNSTSAITYSQQLEQPPAGGGLGSSSSSSNNAVAVASPPTEHYVMQGLGGSLDQQQVDQVNLAELYVVSQHTSPADLAAYGAQAAAAIQTSDVSFGSTTDRSTTERASLCPHHQAQLPAALSNGVVPGAIYDPSFLYGTIHKQPHVAMQASGAPGGGLGLPGQQHNHLQLQQQQHNHHGSHLHLSSGNQHGLLADEGDEDEVDVERMLKSCLDNKMRSSSSLLHLSRHSKAPPTTSNHHFLLLKPELT